MSDTKNLSRSLPIVFAPIGLSEFLNSSWPAGVFIPVEVVAVALCEYVVANDRPMSVTYGVVRQYLANG